MQTTKATQLAQSASAIGAAILGFGIGAQWGTRLQTFAIAILIIGAIIHTYGMYVTQMKNTERTSRVAKTLWLTAWLCLLALTVIIIYMII